MDVMYGSPSSTCSFAVQCKKRTTCPPLTRDNGFSSVRPSVQHHGSHFVGGGHFPTQAKFNAREAIRSDSDPFACYLLGRSPKNLNGEEGHRLIARLHSGLGVEELFHCPASPSKSRGPQLHTRNSTDHGPKRPTDGVC